MRTRARAVFGATLAFALLFPQFAWAADALKVSYTLPPDWIVEGKVGVNGTPFGTMHLHSPEVKNDLTQTLSESLIIVSYKAEKQYKSFEEFRAGTNPDYAPPPPPAVGGGSDGQGMPAPPPGESQNTTEAESGKTTFKGQPAYYTTVTLDEKVPAFMEAPAQERKSSDTTYYIDRGDSSVFIYAGTTAWGSEIPRYSELVAQNTAVLDSLTLDFGTAPTGNWRTVVDEGPSPAAIAAALAAAAIAMVGAFLSTPEGRRRAKEDPTMVVGHLLQLSTNTLDVAHDHQTPIEATAWRVRANGSYEHAGDAVISITGPRGVAVSPSTGTGTLRAGAWQVGAIHQPAVLTIAARTSNGATSHGVAVHSSDEAKVEIVFDPAEKTSLAADEKDSVTLVARVAPAGGGTWPAGVDVSAIRASIAFRSADDRWLYGSEPADWGADARAVRMQAHQPDPVHPVASPDHINVDVTATDADGQTLRAVVAVGIARQPVLDVSPDNFTLPLGSRDSVRVALTVRDPGTPQWSYDKEWPKDTQVLGDCAFVEDTASTGTLTFTEAAPEATGGESPRLTARLRIIASAQGYVSIDRFIDVAVLKEGLFAETLSRHPDGTYHVRADGKKNPQTIVFRAYVRDPATGQIAATPECINALKFQPLDDPGTTERASADFSQLAVEYRVEASAAEREPGGAYSFVYRREVPGKGEVRPVRYLVTAPGLDPDKFWCEIKLGLETEAVEPDSPEWQAEYHRAEDIIRRLMPASYYATWMQTLQTRSKFLGVEGMAELRKRIWINATELVLAQGAEGYTAEANWADGIVKSLEIAELAGDIAMQYLCSRFLGPAAGQAAQTVKPILTSAIGEYLAGTSPDEWVHMQVAQLGGILESRTVDVAAWEKMRPTARWKLWAIFVCYHFGKAHFGQGQSIMDSIKIAAEQAAGVVVMGWAQQKLHQLGGTTAYADAPAPRAKPAGPTTVAAPRARTLAQSGPGATLAKPGKPQRPRVPTGTAPSTSAPESPAAARIRSATKMGPDGIPFADREAVLATMRDPIATRTLKTASPEVQAAFNNTRNQIYREHDAAVLRELRTQPDMKGKRLAVVEVRTASADPDSLNTDHDFHVVEVRTDPATGHTEAIEVKQSRWQAISDKAFAKATGGPADNPVAARKYAKDHQQNPSDEFHGEASPDLAMRGYVKDPDTGQWRQAQVRPNIELVKEGKGVLHDPEALGKTYETKVNEAYHLSKENRGEAYVQAGKAVETMTQVRAGYARQGLTVSQLSPKMRAGMAVVGQGKACFDNPAAVAAADAKLKAAGFRGGLPDFMGKVSGHFEALKWSVPR